MTEQLKLVDDTKIVSSHQRTLTANQQLAFDYIASRDGVTCDEIGAWVHAHRARRPHSVDVRCDWCAKTGRQLVTSKALAPLVTYRRAPGGSLYRLRDHKQPAQPHGEHVSHVIPDDPFAGL